MTVKVKTFEQLTTRELYEILKLRSEVFIVEQRGCYQDLDGIDLESIHVFYENEKQEVIGCIRIFRKKDERATVQFGRLVIKERKKGLGRQLIKDAQKIAEEKYGAEQLYLTGRESALGFYLKCGFYVDSPRLLAGSVPYYEFRCSIKNNIVK